MKKIFLSALLLCATVLGTAAFPRVLINPGHGGHDHDDRGITMPLNVPMFWESEGNLTRGLYVRDFLKELGGTISGDKGTVGGSNTIALTRVTNTSADDLDLTYIATLSNSHGGYFMSLHTNGGNASANYTIAFFRGATYSPYSQVIAPSQAMGLALAQEHQSHNITNTTYSTARSQSDYAFWGWNYGVLRTNSRPGYLIEAWFHDYRPETLRLKSDHYNKFLAWQTVRGFYKSPGGIGKLKGCIVGDVRDLTKGCGYSNYATRGRDSYLAINNATVNLYNSGGAKLQTIKTDAYCNGVFAFFGLATGTYTVEVTNVTGYKTATASVSVTENEASVKQINLTAGVDSGISFNPTSTGYGETSVGNTSGKTITVKGTGLSGAITVTNSDNTNFSVTPTSLPATGGTLSITYKPQSKGSHSTTITCKSGDKSATCVVTGTASNAVPTFTEGWNFSEKNGKKADWMGGVYTNCRNMAFGNGKLYIVDAPNGKIKVVKAQTAELIKELDMTGVSGGALALVDVTFIDGKLVGTSVATNRSSWDDKNSNKVIDSDEQEESAAENKQLKVYVWDNDDAKPKCILSTTNLGSNTDGTMDRVGDAIEIKGNLTNGTICYLGQQARYYTTDSGTKLGGNCNSLVTYAITNGVVSTTPVVKDIDGFIVGGSPRLIPYGNDYIAVGQNYRPSVVTAAGELTQSLTTTALQACQGNDIAVFSYKGDTYAFATEYDPGTAGQSGTMLYNGKAAFINLTDGWADATRAANYPSTGFSSKTRNTTCSSSICVNVNADKGIEMWVLVHNQGIAYYKHGTVPTYTYDTPVTPEPEPEQPSYETTDDVTGLSEVWNFSYANGKTANWLTNGSQSVVDMAFNDGKLYVASRPAANQDKLYVVDAYTGAKKGELNITPCTVGTYLISSVEVLGGKVIASNLAGGGTSVLNVYMWDNDSATPTTLLSTTSHNGVRTGDAMSVSGDLTNGRIWFAYDDKVFYYTVKNGAVTSTDPTVIELTKKDGSSYKYSASSGASNITVESDGSFWISSKDWRPAHFAADGKLIEEIGTGLLSDSQGTDIKFVTLGTKKYGFATNYLRKATPAGCTDSTVADGAFEMFNVTSGLSSATKVGTYPSAGLGNIRNTSFRTALCTEVNDEDLNVWVLVGFQGVAHYKFTHTKVVVTGIESVETEVEAPAEYYNLQGVKVANPAKGLYIKKQGDKATKVIL